MAKTTVNLSDAVTTWVTKTNDLSNTIGDLANLNTSEDSDIVGAINEIKIAIDKTDSADVTNIARSSFQILDAGGDGGLVYDSATGNITYTGPSADSVRDHFAGGYGIEYDSTSGNIAVDSSEIRSLFSVEDSGGSGALSYDSARGTFIYRGPGKGDLPAIISGAGTQSFAAPGSNDQYVRVNCTGNMTLDVGVGNLEIGQTVVVDKIDSSVNTLSINWKTGSQGVSLGTSVELAVGFFNGSHFSFIETVKG